MSRDATWVDPVDACLSGFLGASGGPLGVQDSELDGPLLWSSPAAGPPLMLVSGFNVHRFALIEPSIKKILDVMVK